MNRGVSFIDIKYLSGLVKVSHCEDQWEKYYNVIYRVKWDVPGVCNTTAQQINPPFHRRIPFDTHLERGVGWDFWGCDWSWWGYKINIGNYIMISKKCSWRVDRQPTPLITADHLTAFHRQPIHRFLRHSLLRFILNCPVADKVSLYNSSLHPASSSYYQPWITKMSCLKLCVIIVRFIPKRPAQSSRPKQTIQQVIMSVHSSSVDVSTYKTGECWMCTMRFGSIPYSSLLFQRMCLYLQCRAFCSPTRWLCFQHQNTPQWCSIVLFGVWLFASGSFMTHGAGTLSAPLSSSCLRSWRWLRQVTLVQQWWWFHSAYRSE